jgi:hypothetical protein
MIFNSSVRLLSIRLGLLFGYSSDFCGTEPPHVHLITYDQPPVDTTKGLQYPAHWQTP